MIDLSKYDLPISDETKVGFWVGVGCIISSYFGGVSDTVGASMFIIGIGCAIFNGFRWIDHNRIYKARRASEEKWKK